MRRRVEAEDTADEQTAESAPSSCSRISQQFNALQSFGFDHLSALDDKHISRKEFPTALYLLINQNPTQELIDFNFGLEPSVAKLVCVRTSSKGCPPSV